MPSLKELQVRINSIKSTKKITSAMKMVAASRLKKAQEAVNGAKNYTKSLEEIYAVALNEVRERINNGVDIKLPSFITGRVDKVENIKHLVIVHSSDRGLCGGFNATIAKFTKSYILDLQSKGKEVQLMCVGRKARDILKYEFSKIMIDYEQEDRHLRLSDTLGIKLMDMYMEGAIDEVSVVYNRFISAMSHIPEADLVLPLMSESTLLEEIDVAKDSFFYTFEPNTEEVLLKTSFALMRNRLYRAGVESMASEQGARMTSMDSSTRNAGEIIDRLTLTYNRRRQAAITTELVEIIAGAEAV